MTAKGKTPVMVLQEYTVKNTLSPPEYSIIHSKTGTHDNEFHYQVLVNGLTAFGFGRSKQVAKHAAAFKALEMLAEKEGTTLDVGLQSFDPKLHRNETDNPQDQPVNYIGALKYLCAEKKICYPIFRQLSDVGPPHARQFTWNCRVASIMTQATANTKKQAKQLCAKEMLERITEILPELVKEDEFHDKALPEMDIVSKYIELTPFPDIVVNKAINVGDYNLSLKMLLENKGINAEQFRESLLKDSEEGLKEALDALDLTYRFDEIQSEPNVYTLSISFDIPFTCLGMGDDREIAKKNALQQAILFLKTYLDI